MVGPNGVGPFHSPDWRIGMTVQLVEGGSNGPYWLATPDDSEPSPTDRPDYLLIDSIEPEDIGRSLLLMLLAIVGSDSTVEQLLTSGCLIASERGMRFPSPWRFNKRTLKDSLESLTHNSRIGIVSLDEYSILTEQVVDYLRAEKLNIVTFRPSASIQWD